MPPKRPETIPAFLSFDVEPDVFQLPRDGAAIWPGYGSLYEFASAWRREVERVSGAKPVFGWYFRLDPQVAQACGRADDALRRYPARLDSLRAEGDCFGVHTHSVRWSPDRRLWVHDVADRAWIRECTASSLDAFESAMGEAARLTRAGAGFLCEEMFDVLEEHGVEAELALEPVTGAAPGPTSISSGVDTSPVVGRYADCGAAPRAAYRPARGDFLRPGGADARPIAVVPMSTAPRRLPPSAWGLPLRRLVGRAPRPRPTRVLCMTGTWPSERYFWDLAAHQISTMERPYVSLALRTDTPGCAAAERVRGLLSALTRHPLAKRLRFVSPLDALERIVPRAPVSAAARS